MYDGIPNPAYGRSPAFAPTLRMEVNDEKMSYFETAGLTIKGAEDQFAGYFHDANITDGIRFFADAITVVETGQTLKNFQSIVNAIFEIDNTYHLKLATGDVVALKFYRV